MKTFLILCYVFGIACTLQSDDVTRTVSSLTEKIERLENRFNEMEKNQNKCQSTVGKMESEISYLKEKLRGSDQAARQKRAADPNHVAFSSRLSHNVASLGKQQTIVFDVEITDTGRNYDNYTGIFSPPVAGTYAFLWTAATRYGHYQETELVRNGNPVAFAVTDSPGDYTSTTNSVILHLNVDEKVWIRTGTLNSNHRLDENHLNTFSGWLIFAD